MTWDIGINITVLIILLIWIPLCLYVIARKTRTPNRWLAWIPVANIYLMCKVAGRPAWWTILFFVPLVNIIVGIVVWIGIAQARNQSSWLGRLMIIPIANIFIPAILAFGERHPSEIYRQLELKDLLLAYSIALPFFALAGFLCIGLAGWRSHDFGLFAVIGIIIILMEWRFIKEGITKG